MYAIVKSGGRQYKVSPGDILRVEKLSLEKGSEVVLDKVLMVSKEDRRIFGSPYVSGAEVLATVDDTGKASKVIVFKQKPRKASRKLRGHRQPYTSLKIKEIVLGDKYGT
ncbi:MAG: 50S ribosomal protein L21 [Nitrospirota bacterium]